MIKKLKNLYHNLKILSSCEARCFLVNKVEQLRVVQQFQRHSKVTIHNDAIIKGSAQGKLNLGRNVRIEAFSILSLGNPHEGYGSLEIGADTWIGEHNNIRTSSSKISIGQNCLISQFCSLIATNHSIKNCNIPISQQGIDESKTGIKLADDVWLGTGVTILPGVTIGKGAVVAANSTVNKNIGEHEIWAGSPAKKIASRL